MTGYQTKELLDQHNKLINEATHILSLIKADKIDNAKEILEKLTHFGKELETHLIIEDKILYPILRIRSEIMNTICDKYLAEMGDLRDKVNTFITKWCDENLIRESRKELVLESEQLITELAKRISKENDELFPLI